MKLLTGLTWDDILDDMIFEQSLDEIAAKTAISDHHEDAREGALAFKEKRPAHFNRWLEGDA